jgi:hypothetical protein
VAGATVNGSGNYDILVAKYNSSGVQQWIQQYNGAGNNQDMATSLYIDASSNVYITGVVTTATNIDMVTIKYNSSGTQQWLSTYNGAGSTYDCGADLITDASGNVYVCGSAYNAAGNLDYVTIKYNSSGTQQWATLYAHTSNLNDAPVKIAYRALTGVVTVSGAVQTGATAYSFGVIKYGASTGAQQAATITAGGSSGIDQVFDMAVDTSGNTYIAGGIPVGGQGYNTCIIKLNSSLAIQWQATYNGASNLDDMANGIMVNDVTGNVYFTGYTTSSTQGKNFLTVKYNSSGTQQWAQTYNDTLDGDDVANGIIIDASDNVYVTGYDSTATNGTDYYTIKYNSSGTQIWNVRDDGDAHSTDKATNIAMSGTSNIAVTGGSKKADGTYEFKTIKYVQKDIITPTDYNSETALTGFLYYANKGQLRSTNDTAITNTVKFYNVRNYPQIYFKSNSHSLVFGHVDTVRTTLDTLQRIDVTFNQASASAKTYPMDQMQEFNQYYLAHCPSGVTAYANQRLITTNLYTNIDLMYYSNQNGFKYYFIVKPGGSPTSIQLEYTGATSFALNGTTNALTISSAFGSITYDRPQVYQLNSSNVIVPITTWTADWQTNGATNKYKFNIGAYDNTKALIIQVDCGNAASCTPLNSYKNIRLSTYYGATYWDRFNGNTADNQCHYNVGNCSGTGFPITTGTATVYGDETATLTKFDTYGFRKWCLYYGGTSSDLGYGVAMDWQDKPYIFGQTYSNNLTIVHPGNSYFQSAGYAGAGDAFMARFNSLTAALEYSCYYGGTGNDGFRRGKHRMTDSPYDYMYVVGFGDQTSPHVTRTGAYNSPTTPSEKKGIIARFLNDSLIWSTFIGSDIYGLDIDGSLIGIGGESKSNTLPYKRKSGASYVDSTYNSASPGDAFFGILCYPQDTIDWCSYYGGSKADVCSSVKWDHGVEGSPPNLYGCGSSGIYSSTTNDMQTYNPGGSAYSGSYHNASDAVFWKFSSVGTRLWCTYYGTGSQGASNEMARDLIVDKNNNIYFCGDLADQMENISYGTHNWYQQNYTHVASGYQNFVCAVTSKNLNMFWATTYGGNYGENAGSLAYDFSNNYLYLTGFTFSANTVTFPAYRPVGYSTAAWYRCEHQPTYSEGDGYFVQFDITDGIYSGINDYTRPQVGGLISFPNPFSNDFTLNFAMGEAKEYVIEIYNTLGQLVYTEKERTGNANISKAISLPEVDKGMYFVQVILGDQALSGRIIKQ